MFPYPQVGVADRCKNYYIFVLGSMFACSEACSHSHKMFLDTPIQQLKPFNRRLLKEAPW